MQYAFEYGMVVRLKGGDPFIFGRGFEELEYAQAFNIEVEIVPGISSALALPALQQIPLTQRGLSRGFWVLTATTKEGQLSQELQLAAKSNSTVVILMGMRKLAQIVQLYKKEAKAQLPVAVIQNGSRPNEKKVWGHIYNIEKLVEEQKMGTPAIIVIGEVVALAQQQQMSRHPPQNSLYKIV